MPDIIIPAAEGGEQRAYLSRPVGAGPWPGVVVLQDAMGMTADLRSHTDHLAAAGYLALAPRLYSARGGGPRCVAAVIRSMTSGEGPVYEDIESARAWLSGRSDCTARIGVAGFCQGAGFALLAAARYDFAAAAPNYGQVPDDETRQLEGICPVVASFGAKDPTLKGHPERLERALRDLDVEHDVEVYPGAGHAFHEHFYAQRLVRPLGFGHDEAASRDSWRRIETFFAAHLVAG